MTKNFLESILSNVIDKCLFAMSIYLSILHNYHTIDVYAIKEVKIMRNNNNYLRHASPFFYLGLEDVERSDIESRIYLIKEDKLRIKKSDLKHLYPTLLSSGKSDIEISIKEFWFNTIFWEHLLHHTTKYEWGWYFFSWMLFFKSMIVDRSKVLYKSDSWDFWHILK